MKLNDFDGNQVTAPMVPWLLNLNSCNIIFFILPFCTLRDDNKLEVSLQYLKKIDQPSLQKLKNWYKYQVTACDVIIGWMSFIMKPSDFDYNQGTVPMVPWLLNLRSCNIHNAVLMNIHPSAMSKKKMDCFLSWWNLECNASNWRIILWNALKWQNGLSKKR